MDVPDCLPMVKFLKSGLDLKMYGKFLRKYICRFDGYVAKVCCPFSPISVPVIYESAHEDLRLRKIPKKPEEPETRESRIRYNLMKNYQSVYRKTYRPNTPRTYTA